MPEPSLSELTNIPSDASLGTSGLTAVVPDSRALNAQIYDAAKFKANMDWQRYTTFLNNFKEVTKEGSEIAKMDLAPQDREKLQGDMATILSEIAKDPKSALGGKKMFDIQSKLQKLTSDATLSRQDNAFDKYHRQFLDRTPDMKTEENKAKVEGYLQNQPLGARQPYILDPAPPEFDASLLGGILEKKNTDTYTKSYVSDATGKPGKGYLYDESGTEFNPTAYIAQWDLALQDDPKIGKAIEARYNKLPESVKKIYPTKEQWYHQLGVEHANAIVPAGTEQEKTDKGNIRYGKKSKIVRDPSDLEWFKAWTGRIDANKPAAGNASKPPTVIEAPAILLGEHIDRLKKDFNNGKATVTVSETATDPKTKLALGLQDNEKVTYKPDGSYVILDEKGKTRTVGTIDNLVQGFIQATKVVDINPETDKDGTMAQGFQTNSENYLKQLFGTTKGSDIWNTWDDKKSKSANKSESKTSEGKVKTISSGTIKSLVGKKGYEGYSEKEIIDYYKSNGYEVK
jgi:hypothetical protein